MFKKLLQPSFGNLVSYSFLYGRVEKSKQWFVLGLKEIFSTKSFIINFLHPEVVGKHKQICNWRCWNLKWTEVSVSYLTDLDAQNKSLRVNFLLFCPHFLISKQRLETLLLLLLETRAEFCNILCQCCSLEMIILIFQCSAHRIIFADPVSWGPRSGAEGHWLQHREGGEDW